MDFFLPAGAKRPGLAVVSFGEGRVSFELLNKLIVSTRLLHRQINVEDKQRDEAHNRHIVRSRTNLPKLSPVHILSTHHVGTAALGCPVERSSTSSLFTAKQPGFARQDSRGRLSPHKSITLRRLSAPGAVYLLRLPALPLLARKFRHLFLRARSARSSAPKPRSEFQCSARCRTAATRSHPRSIRPTARSARRYTASCPASIRTAPRGPTEVSRGPCSFRR